MCVDENEDTIVLCLDSLFCPSSPACSDAVSHEWTMPKQPSSRLQYCVLCWCLAPVRPGHDPKLDYWMCRIKVQHWTQTWGSDSEVIWNGLGRTIMKGLKWTTLYLRNNNVPWNTHLFQMKQYGSSLNIVICNEAYNHRCNWKILMTGGSMLILCFLLHYRSNSCSTRTCAHVQQTQSNDLMFTGFSGKTHNTIQQNNIRHASPQRSLDARRHSSQYWKWSSI